MGTKQILIGSAFYSAGNMLGAGLNMLYQFVLMIFLSSEDYGIIQPLLQFIGLLILPVMAYQYALTKHFSLLPQNDLSFESILTVRNVFFYMIFVTILWIFLVPIFQNVFHVKDRMIFYLLLISLLLHFPQAPFISRLQAEKRFIAAGIAQALQGIVRITLGLVCVWLMPNIVGAMIGVLISNIAFVMGNTIPYRESFFISVPKSYKKHPFSWKLLLVSLGSVGLFSLLIYSDTVLVRSLLPEQSALFASSNLLGKGMIFLTTGVSFVILPIMSSKFEDAHKSLWLGFACLLILIGAYILFFYLTAPFLAGILFKKDADILAGFQILMPQYNLVFLPYPLIYYFLNYYLIKESVFYPCILGIGIVGLYLGLFFMHDTLLAVNLVIGIIGYCMLGIVIFHALLTKSKPERIDMVESLDVLDIEN